MPRQGNAEAREFAARIRKLRRRGGWNLTEVGRQASIPYRTLQRWESGDVIPKEGEYIRRLAWFYRVTPGYLLDGDTE